jgi:hypothetical protein
MGTVEVLASLTNLRVARNYKYWPVGTGAGGCGENRDGACPEASTCLNPVSITSRIVIPCAAVYFLTLRSKAPGNSTVIFIPTGKHHPSRLGGLIDRRR